MRDRKHDMGGHIWTSRGFMNLGCIFILVAGIMALLYEFKSSSSPMPLAF